MQARISRLREILPKNVPLSALEKSLKKQLAHELAEILSGIKSAQQAVSKVQPRKQYPLWWQLGSMSVYDLAPELPADAPIVLCIPSLINRAYILDLTKNRSMMKYMAEAGLRPLLVEWRDPLVHEFSFAVEDYITARLEPLLAYVHERFPARRPYLLGYCMGGLLAIAAAVRKPQFVRGVIMLATPWDFHCREYEPLRLPNIAKEILEKQNGENLSPLPGAWVQALFYALYPNVVAQKFKNLALAARDEESAKTRAELEYWVNDGVAMTHPVARDCLNIWLSENQPARGLWKVCGVTIRPEEISCPGFFALPTRDYIVPLSSSSLLASQMTRSPLNVITPFAGHVGMVVGSRADELLWKPMLTWALTQQAV